MWPQTAKSSPRTTNPVAVYRHHVSETIERNDHVGRGLRDARVDLALRAAHALVDAGRHRLAYRDQLLGTMSIARQRQFRVVKETMFVQQAAESRKRSVDR